MNLLNEFIKVLEAPTKLDSKERFKLLEAAYLERAKATLKDKTVFNTIIHCNEIQRMARIGVKDEVITVYINNIK